MKDTDRVRLLDKELLSNDWGTLTKYTFKYKRSDGSWQTQTREVYDRGHGVTCLLHNPETGCILLTRQFRLPVLIAKGDPFMIEAPAGLLEGARPDERMRAELMEETGFQISDLTHLFDLQMSPGSVCEVLSYYSGTYSLSDQVEEGGGNVEEGEDIEVLHIPLTKALDMIRSGSITDAKTVILVQNLALSNR